VRLGIRAAPIPKRPTQQTANPIRQNIKRIGNALVLNNGTDPFAIDGPNHQVKYHFENFRKAIRLSETECLVNEQHEGQRAGYQEQVIHVPLKKPLTRRERGKYQGCVDRVNGCARKKERIPGVSEHLKHREQNDSGDDRDEDD
jgi:hypothetical protein